MVGGLEQDHPRGVELKVDFGGWYLEEALKNPSLEVGCLYFTLA
jgi:hypothetical protein